MVFQLKKNEIESRLSNSNKGNGIPFLDGAYITSGEHIMHKDDDDEGRLKCGQVIDVVELRDIPKDERSNCASPIEFGKLVNTKERCALTRIILTVDEVKNPKISAVEMPEALKEAAIANTLTYIKVGTVMSAAYLFHKQDVFDGKYRPGGLRNAFLVRRMKQSPESKKYIQLKKYDAFHNRKSYSKRQWDARVAINEQSRQTLSRKNRIQKRTEHLHFPGMNVEAYEDIEHVAKDGEDDAFIELEPLELFRPKKIMMGDLSNRYIANVKHSSKSMRAIDEPAVKKLRSSLGSTFGIGNPMTMPKIAEVRKMPKKIANVRVGDGVLVRIVTCKVEDEDAEGCECEPLAVVSSGLPENPSTEAEEREVARIARQTTGRTCPFPGIDVEHLQSDTGLTDLHIALKHKKLKGDSPQIKAYTGRNTRKKTKKRKHLVDELALPNVVTADSSSDEDTVAYDTSNLVDQEIDYNGELYRINSVSEDGAMVSITRFATDDNPTTITAREATHILLSAARG